MTNSWITKEMEEEIQEKVQTITFGQSELSEEEIAEIKPIWLKHHKEHKGDNDIFEDNGIAIIWFEAPEVPRTKDGKPKIKIYTNKDGSKRTNFLCKWKLGFVGVWGSLEFWKPLVKQPGKIIVARGKLMEQYDIRGTYGIGEYEDSTGEKRKRFSEKQYFKSLKEAGKKTGIDTEALDEDDIFKTYTFNAWQILG